MKIYPSVNHGVTFLRSLYQDFGALSSLPSPGLDWRTEFHRSMSSASSRALLRMDLSTKRVWSSISMPEILAWQEKTKNKTQVWERHKTWNHHVFTFIPAWYVSEESRGRKETVPTWSRWSCWLDPASPRASDSSNTDCRCYKSYLEARAAGQLMAWLYLGSGLEEQKVNTVFCFSDGWVVGEIQTPWCLYKLSFFGISWPYISAHFLCLLSFFFNWTKKD